MDVSTTRTKQTQKQETTMYYKSGNYEAFARPRKPKGVDEKSAYLVGSGIGSLAAAVFLIRDGHLAGNRIPILEAAKPPGRPLDGIKPPPGVLWIRRQPRAGSHT